jgi:hypothetical protein
VPCPANRMGCGRMDDSKRQLWPFGPRVAVLTVPLMLVSLLLLIAVVRAITGWPGPTADSAVLIGVLVLSLLPVILLLADLLIERGAVLEYQGLKLDLSRMSATGSVSVSVPSNIGVPGRAVNDSSSTEILGTLRAAVDHDVVIVDLHEGEAWWETRLLVLAAGAARRQRPSAIVFTGKDGGVPGRFQGWAEPAAILGRLLACNDIYRAIYYAVEAAAQNWALVEPIAWGAAPPCPPPQPSWIDGLAARYFWMAFDAETGMPNELRFEQLLASELGEKVEQPHAPPGISLVRLEELFRPILHKHAIDEAESSREQLENFFRDDALYIAMTRDGCYQRLIPRRAALNAILKSIAAGHAQ